MAWAMIVRTQVFDEIIMAEIATDGIDLVLNLAAGLDARPWRLALPAVTSLGGRRSPRHSPLQARHARRRQTEMRLRGHRGGPHRCDACARRCSRGSARESKRALILSEGLLIYPSPEQVGALATDLHAQPAFERWVIDLANPRLLKMMSKSWGASLAAGNAPFKFAPASGTAFFREFGWEERAFHSTMEEAERLDREMKMMWLWKFLGRFYPARMREEFRRMSGIVVLERI